MSTCGVSHLHAGLYLGLTCPHPTKLVEILSRNMDDFPVKLKKSQMAAMPMGEGLYNLGQGKKLCKEDAEAFHTMLAKGLFVCK